MSINMIASILTKAKLHRFTGSNIRKRGFSLTQLTLLFILEETFQGGHPRPHIKVLAEVLDMSAASISSAVTRLEEQKLVVKAKEHQGGRGGHYVYPTITRQGQKILALLMK